MWLVFTLWGPLHVCDDSADEVDDGGCTDAGLIGHWCLHRGMSAPTNSPIWLQRLPACPWACAATPSPSSSVFCAHLFVEELDEEGGPVSLTSPPKITKHALRDTQNHQHNPTLCFLEAIPTNRPPIIISSSWTYLYMTPPLSYIPSSLYIYHPATRRW